MYKISKKENSGSFIDVDLLLLEQVGQSVIVTFSPTEQYLFSLRKNSTEEDICRDIVELWHASKMVGLSNEEMHHRIAELRDGDNVVCTRIS